MAFALSSLMTAPPNVVLVVADDLGYGDLGCYGATDILTPNINQLASSGLRMKNGYVVSPICAPSRAGLMTGRYPQDFGFEFNLDHLSATNHAFGVPTTETMLAERLKGLGYATGLIGKWHLGSQAGLTPRDRGFDYFYGFLGGGAPYIYPTLNGILPILDNGVPSMPTKYLTNEFSDRASAFIDQNADHPFFLTVAYNAPHTPLQATQADLDRYPNLTGNRKTIAAMISAMDDGVGEVQAALARNGISENTIVIFLSDNGGVVDNGSSNAPFRGGKYEVTEGGIRVPFIASWPSHIEPNQVSTLPCLAIDIVPTLMNFVGAPIVDGSVDGTDLTDALLAQANGPDRTFYWRFGGKEAVLNGSRKLEREDDDQDLELFDISQDLFEANNLALANAEQVTSLSNSLQAWEQTLSPALWGPIPNPDTKSLVLMRDRTNANLYRAVTLDYQGNPINAVDFRTFTGIETAKIGRFRSDADLDIATIEGDQIIIRSWLNDGTKLTNLRFQNKGATRLIGFADFNGNGQNELVFQTPDGFKGAEINPTTGLIDYIVMNVDIDFGAYTRILGTGDMDDDGGPDMIVADAQNKVSYLYFDHKRAQRIVRKFFNPNFITDPAAAHIQYVAAIDLDGDGSIDLLNDPNVPTVTDPVHSGSVWRLSRLKPEIRPISLTMNGIYTPVAAGSANPPDPFDD